MNTVLKIIDAVIGLNTGILFSSLVFTGSNAWHISLPIVLLAMHTRMMLSTMR
jgi:hypothetical protein